MHQNDTHQLGVEVINGKLLLNPGSISYPRGKYTAIGGTFAIVERRRLNQFDQRAMTTLISILSF